MIHIEKEKEKYHLGQEVIKKIILLLIVAIAMRALIMEQQKLVLKRLKIVTPQEENPIGQYRKDQVMK